MLLLSFEITLLRSEYASIRMMLKTQNIYVVSHVCISCVPRQCSIPQKHTWPLPAALITSQTLQKFPNQNKILKLFWGLVFFSPQVSNNIKSLWHPTLSQPFTLIMNFSSYKLWIPHAGRRRRDRARATASALAICCISPAISLWPGRQQGCMSDPWFCLLNRDLLSASLSETRSPPQSGARTGFSQLLPLIPLSPTGTDIRSPGHSHAGKARQEGGQSLGDALTQSRSRTVPRNGTIAASPTPHDSHPLTWDALSGPGLTTATVKREKKPKPTSLTL